MTQTPEQAIAVIGMSGRFPGARDVAAFWRNLESGAESIRFFSDAELLKAGVDARLLANPNYVKARGALDDVDLFDAAFFGFTPREAEAANPQQRLFLECAWEALEHAGYPPQRDDRSIGVFASAGTNGYWQQFIDLVDRGGLSPFQLSIGNDKDYLATRVSYKLNLRGPSVAVQTACSGSLVAVHLACQSLLAGDCDLALAGGAAVGFPPKAGHLFEEGHINSRDGHCRVFDARATGTVRGDGVAVAVLKPLAEALADRDHIWGVIRGSAINNDGDVKVGYTAPGIAGQAAVIQSAQTFADVDPETIGYVECHGTGTALGDPVEIAALTKAFRAGTSRRGYCAVGSVKSNIGHLDVAAGLAGLIKAVLALHHELIPRTLHFTTANPQIDFENSPFYVAGQPRPWPSSSGHPRRAGVSSFGIGGTNAHVVLEEAPPPNEATAPRRHYVLPISARTPAALERQTASCREYLMSATRADVADVAYTLQQGRCHFAHRRSVVCCEEELARGADPMSPTRMHTGAAGRADQTVVFMFPGQGAQYPGMGRGLYEAERVFREEVDRCAAASRAHLGLDLRQVLYGEMGAADALQRLDDTDIAQPALFAVEYALARLWMHWGIRPSAMIGHSIGEYVAACLAGVFSLDDAIALVAARGRVMQQMPVGAMLVVPLGEADVSTFLTPDLSLAAVNGPERSVVAGTVEAIATLDQRLVASGLGGQRLRTSRAFHSHLLTPVLDRFRDELARVRLNAPELPYVSNVSGTWIDAASATSPDYWIQHARQPVRFAKGIETLAGEGDRVFLEVGPGRALSQAVRTQTRVAPDLVYTSLPHRGETAADEPHILISLGGLWANGIDVDWNATTEGRRGRRVPLSTYPFERARYWPENGLRCTARAHPRERADGIDRWLYVPSWKRSPNPPAIEPELPRHLETCLLFEDSIGVGGRLAERLRERGSDVTEVVAGDRFGRGGDRFEIDPSRREDYGALIAALAREGRVPRTVVHLWTLDGARRSACEAFEAGQRRGFHSVTLLTQAVAAQHLGAPMRVALVSNRAQSVHGGERLDPAAATMLGAARVIAQEYPNLACRAVDLDIEPDRAEAVDTAVDQILAELVSDSREPVAYRGRCRWVQEFEPCRTARPSRPLRDRGVYLITGGLGRVGCAVAESLARRCRARLVLTTHAPFSDRSEWASLAASAADIEIRRRATSLLRIEEAGGSVLVIQADSADAAQVQRAIETAEETFGALNGVVHAAGATAREALREVADVTEAVAGLHWRPKVHGLVTLDVALGDRRLDFRVAMSSLASVLGGLGFAAYAAANAFMDLFAHASWQTPARKWVSVNWDGWRFDDPPRTTRILRAAVLDPLLPVDGALDVFEAIVTTANEPQVIVSVADLHERLTRATAASEAESAERPTVSTPAPQAAATTSFGTELERALAGIWSQLLGVADISSDDNFFTRGGDSLVGTRLISRVRELFQVDLPVRTAFEAPSIAAMARAIVQHDASPGRSEKIAAALNRLRP